VTSRDRIVLMVLAVAGMIAACWFLALSPKREEAKTLSEQIATEHQRLDKARADAATARAAKDRYDVDYAIVARLGKAVPTDDGVPSLLTQLQAAAKGSKVDFVSVNVGKTDASTPTTATTAAQAAALAQAQKGESASTTSAASASTASTLPPGAAVGSAGFPTMGYDLRFDGSFFAMQRFLDRVQRLVSVHGDQIAVNGRLLTIDNFALAAGPKGFPQVTPTISATGYLLPPDAAATGGATPASPSTSTDSTSTTNATVTGVK